MKYHRRYRHGTCQDCGRTRNVTKALWWVSGFAMILCAECLREYRPQLLRPGNASDPYWTRTTEGKSA